MAIDYGSPDIVLTALAAIMPVGTTIATVLIQKGITALGATYPVLLLNAASTQRKSVELQAKQMTCTVTGIYLDLYAASSGRTLEQALEDAQAALNQCAANVEANQSLTVAGTPNALRAGGTIGTDVNAPLTDEGLGFPTIAGRITIDIQGLIYNY